MCGLAIKPETSDTSKNSYLDNLYHIWQKIFVIVNIVHSVDHTVDINTSATATSSVVQRLSLVEDHVEYYDDRDNKNVENNSNS